MTRLSRRAEIARRRARPLTFRCRATGVIGGEVDAA
ncbi:hypothetical protein BTH_II0696 [Burkholderia thailandensis E264]|uniref:Uncharacterized protein n=1 Tax=Burkholderia thailandensis (strain ATCC 700388 / DSM 13276 / CCUG 48851 / CIP 106301 / E264) TaxID=271848 RepID=Q2T7F4_BURTA|nr:hypothetical protein BTH_II0696 [Burkholderia thailandensis E264]